MILFNIIEPTGWKVGLTRIEDVAIGCAVSIVVGLLFWPRGATAALGRALSAAFVANSGYLADAVDRLTIDDAAGGHRARPAGLAQRLSAPGRRLPPVLRRAGRQGGLGRDGVAAVHRRQPDPAGRLHPGPVAGAAPGPGQPELESVAVAGAVLRDSYASSHRWYQEFAEVLADGGDSLDPPPAHDRILHDVLRTRVRGRPRPSAGATGCG